MNYILLYLLQALSMEFPQAEEHLYVILSAMLFCQFQSISFYCWVRCSIRRVGKEKEEDKKEEKEQKEQKEVRQQNK